VLQRERERERERDVERKIIRESFGKRETHKRNSRRKC
jgi:hypothetical protein